MFVYTKVVDNVKKLFGNTTSNKPTADDVELTYKDVTGATLTLTAGDVYLDESKDGVQQIKRKSDGATVNVFIGDVMIIGGSFLYVSTAPTKTEYTAGDSLALAGMKVTLVKIDGTSETVAWNASGVACSPTNGTTLSEEDDKVTVTYKGFTATQAITVAAASNDNNTEQPTG